MNKNNKKLLTTVLVLTLVLVVGTTYAWLRLTKNSNTVNKITAGNLDLVLDEGENITLKNEVPRSYRQGMETKEYTFTITNNSSVSNYKLSLADLEKYTNEDGNEIVIADENRIDDAKIRYILLKDGEVATADKSKILTDRVIDSGTIKKGQTITYSLRLWIDSRAEKEVMGKIFNARLSLVAEQTSGVIPTANIICKRATILHTEECPNYYGACENAGYSSSGSKGTSTVTYGNLGSKGKLESGDAFDCDVNGDGVYDAATERFYYVSDYYNTSTKSFKNDTAVLIYYSNVIEGKATNTTGYKYDESLKNNNGPVTAITQLPTTEQWKNVKLINTSRKILNVNGENTTAAGNLPESFSYDGYAARLLAVPEIGKACNITVGSQSSGELDSCLYFLENTAFTNSNYNFGWWLENPSVGSDTVAGIGAVGYRAVVYGSVDNSSSYAVRPTIEVPKTNIEY